METESLSTLFPAFWFHLGEGFALALTCLPCLTKIRAPSKEPLNLLDESLGFFNLYLQNTLLVWWFICFPLLPSIESVLFCPWVWFSTGCTSLWPGKGRFSVFPESVLAGRKLVFQMSQPSVSRVMGRRARATMPGSLQILILRRKYSSSRLSVVGQYIPCPSAHSFNKCVLRAHRVSGTGLGTSSR